MRFFSYVAFFLCQFYIAFCAISLDMIFTSIVWVFLTTIIFSIFRNSFFKFIAAGMTFVFLLPIAAIDWNNSVDGLYKKAKNESYTELNKLGIYNLNLLMASVGTLAGYPEVALETLLIGAPFIGDEVTLRSNFGLESPKVRALIKSHIRSGRSSSVYNLAWTKKEHSSDSSRVALAINSYGKLYITTKVDSSGRVSYDCRMRAFISYPEKSTTKIQLSSLHPLLYIKMEEAIFTGLQKEGWFKTYYINWDWNTNEQEVDNYKDFFWIDDSLEIILSLSNM